jgi:hypothetical protein
LGDKKMENTAFIQQETVTAISNGETYYQVSIYDAYGRAVIGMGELNDQGELFDDKNELLREIVRFSSKNRTVEDILFLAVKYKRGITVDGVPYSSDILP